MNKIIKRGSLRTETNRRQAIKGAFGLLVAALIPSVADAQQGAAARAADRARRQIRRRHAVVAYHQATAVQRAVALANAKKVQEKYRSRWARTPKGRAYVNANSGGGSTGRANTAKARGDIAKAVPMTRVVKDLNLDPVVAVKVPSSVGAKTGVLPVDLRTGGLVGNGVVEMANVPRAGSSITKHVQEAVADGTIKGNANEWLGGNVVLAKL